MKKFLLILAGVLIVAALLWFPKGNKDSDKLETYKALADQLWDAIDKNNSGALPDADFTPYADSLKNVMDGIQFIMSDDEKAEARDYMN